MSQNGTLPQIGVNIKIFDTTTQIVSKSQIFPNTSGYLVLQDWIFHLIFWQTKKAKQSHLNRYQSLQVCGFLAKMKAQLGPTDLTIFCKL